ncbi:MAG: dihydrofolate reductase, partial [Clostridia bacterium]|nr:dihydrofolate reductase [Clostridia bacterium]
MKAIVAVDKFWGIGKKNGLLFNLPADMAYFREKTLNKVVVMGS